MKSCSNVNTIVRTTPNSKYLVTLSIEMCPVSVGLPFTLASPLPPTMIVSSESKSNNVSTNMSPLSKTISKVYLSTTISNQALSLIAITISKSQSTPNKTVMFSVLSFKSVQLTTPFFKSTSKSKSKKNAKSQPASSRIQFKKVKTNRSTLLTLIMTVLLTVRKSKPQFRTNSKNLIKLKSHMNPNFSVIQKN